MGGKTSNASKAKYNAKTYDRINIAIAKGRKETIREAAEAHGQSINAYIVAAIDEKLERDTPPVGGTGTSGLGGLAP